MKIVSSWILWLNRSTSDPTVSLNLLGFLAVLFHIMQSSAILDIISKDPRSRVPPFDLPIRISVSMTVGWPNDPWIWRSSSSVYNELGISIGPHLCFKKKFSNTNGCVLPPQDTVWSWMLMSRPFCTISFMDNRVWTFEDRSRNYTWIILSRACNGK